MLREIIFTEKKTNARNMGPHSPPTLSIAGLVRSVVTPLAIPSCPLFLFRRSLLKIRGGTVTREIQFTVAERLAIAMSWRITGTRRVRRP